MPEAAHASCLSRLEAYLCLVLGLLATTAANGGSHPKVAPHNEVRRKGHILTAPCRQFPNGITCMCQCIAKVVHKDWKSLRPSLFLPTLTGAVGQNNHHAPRVLVCPSLGSGDTSQCQPLYATSPQWTNTWAEEGCMSTSNIDCKSL